MNYESRIKKSRNVGFTIIETMISVSLFIIIVMAGMGAFLNANLLHDKSRNIRSIVDNLSFVMEDMSRNLRTGYNYRCITDINIDFQNKDTIATPQSGQNCIGIAFEYQNGIPYQYDQNGVLINKHGEDQWVYYIGTFNGSDKLGIYKSVDGADTFVKLTPDEVTIDDQASYFSVSGAEPHPFITSGKQQPFVTIKLVGKITYKGVDTPFSLQTSVSQRVLDTKIPGIDI